MPCYTVTTTQVTLAKNTDTRLLAKAAELLKIGNLYTFDKATGTLTLRGSARNMETELKRAYAVQVARQAAQLGGWQVKQVDAFNLELNKA